MTALLDNQSFEATTQKISVSRDSTGKLTRWSNPCFAYSADGQPAWVSKEGEPIQGVYVDLPDLEYHQLSNMISSSALKLFASDPHEGECRYRGTPDESSISPQLKRAWNCGHLLHGLLLEPERMDYGVISESSALELRQKGAVVIEDHDSLKKYLSDNYLDRGKSIAERIDIARCFNRNVVYYPNYVSKVSEQEKRGKRYICSEDRHRVETCASLVKNTDIYKYNFENSGYSELTIIVFDPSSNMWIKARLDRVSVKRDRRTQKLERFLLDVKTIHTLSPDQIYKDIEQKLYSIQGAFYHYAAQLIGFELVQDEFALLFIEWDRHIRYQLVELSDKGWADSVSYMHEVYEDMVIWLNSQNNKACLNATGIMIVNPTFFKLKKRVRVET